MRRTDREIKDKQLVESVLIEADQIGLAFCPGPGEVAPYVIFVHPLFYEGALYVHCATTGRKLDLLAHNPNVAFTAAVQVHIVRNRFSTRYRSVCGTAVAEPVVDEAERRSLLTRLSARYQAACPDPVPQKMLDQITVLRLTITSLSGKESLPREGDD